MEYSIMLDNFEKVKILSKSINITKHYKHYKCNKCLIIGSFGEKCVNYLNCKGYISIIEDKAETVEPLIEDKPETVEPLIEDKPETVEPLIEESKNKIFWCDHIDCLESIDPFYTEEDMDNHYNDEHA